MGIFNETQNAKTSYSSFNLSHNRIGSYSAGILYPVMCEEYLPGDNFSQHQQQMIKTLPLVSPAMDEYNVYFHYFAVPNRLLDDTWQDFITGGEDGQSDALPPFLENLYQADGTLTDHLGYPTSTTGDMPDVSRLPFAAYHLIYNEYYRDQNLIEKIKPLNDVEGTIAASQVVNLEPKYLSLHRRAWAHDYFTSNLPFAQKGDPVRIPLINSTGQYLGVEFDESGFTLIKREDNSGTSPDGSGLSWPVATNNLVTDATGTRAAVDNSSNLRVALEDLDVNAAYINDLRTAISVQQWMELAARGGSRYVEMINVIFGVRSSDGRLQRPVYLGGNMSPLMISEIDQTSQTTDFSPQGNLAGKGINMHSTHAYNQRFEEHGFIMCLMSIIPKARYMSQGLPRKYSRKSRYDYFWPQFEGIGEQAVLNQELFIGDAENNNKTFGYIPRYSEYKYIPSTVHGEMKNNLDHWHSARRFSNPPALNQEFIECNPPRRIFADTSDSNQFICQIWHNIQAQRKMSYFSPPGLTRI
ncbi:MAG: major capsid protein [Microviridae sp.]|nr:MAG: major capsid protein [Microviridae sp.]